MKWKKICQRLQLLLHEEMVSPEYRAWRHQFLLDRLRLAFWIIFPVSIAITLHNLWLLFGQAQQLAEDVVKFYGDAALIEKMQQATLVSVVIFQIALLGCARLRSVRWGRKHPQVVFLCLCAILNITDLVVGTFFGLPQQPDPELFLAQAILIPIHWRLHLLAQFVPIAYYACVYPLLGLTKIGDRAFFNPYSVQFAINLGWISTIAILSIYLYERLKRSEFEARRQLRGAIHAISHDLKNPAMGTSLVLQNLLRSSDLKIPVDRAIVEQLLAGCDRQLHLIDALLEAQATEAGGLILHREVISLSAIASDAIADLNAIAQSHQTTLLNRIPPELPPLNADKTQLWRVLNNLIANALKHNPSGTTIEITARIIENRGGRWIRCNISDNGIGIPPEQLPHLFQLYGRGARSRRKPGLRLGLYLCQQIIHAHGGEIGVDSSPGRGSTFWFTLPVLA